MKKILCIILSLVLLIGALASCGKGKNEENNALSIPNTTITDEVTDYVVMDIKDFGPIVIHLLPDVAPETVANFKKLVSEGFYDGLIFHRVISEFMIQGGDPQGNGYGGSNQTIKGEFAANGFENNLKHERGVISMARTNDPDSATSQFFIVHQTSANNSYSLDGKYASFGYVVYGIEVVDAIAAVKTDYYDRPLTPVVINSVKFAIVSE